MLSAVFIGASAMPVSADAITAFQNWRALRDAGIVRQSRDYSCGTAALATLLNTLRNGHLTEEELLDLLAHQSDAIDLPQNWQEVGMSFATLRGIARYFGHEAVGVEIEARDLLRLRVPAIAYLPNSDPPHFTVVRSVSGGQLELADPGWGNRRLDQFEFWRLWLDERTRRGRLLLVNGSSPLRLPGAPRPVPIVSTNEGRLADWWQRSGCC